MCEVYVGTAYHQVYCVPLDLKAPIVKLGEKKKCPVTSIYVPDEQQQLDDTIFYSDSQQSFELCKSQNEVRISKTLQLEPNQKILTYQANKKAYFTSHGDIYYESKEKSWFKLFYNEMYANTLKSLPPQKVGKLRPEYTKALAQTSGQNILIGFVGRGVLPFVYEMQESTSLIAWRAKNVQNDELDLEIPANDIDLCFMNNGFHLVAANAQNMVRIYDVKSRRRKPIVDVTLAEIIKAQKSQITRMVKSKCQNYLYVSNHRGSIYQLDKRKNLAVSSKIKGITTTIKDMQLFNNYLSVISLDGYLRIFNTQTRQKLFERYLNTQPQVLRLAEYGINFEAQYLYKQQEIDLNNEEEVEEQNKKMQKVKKIRKRNKVGLKYVQNAKFDDVKLQNLQDQMKQEEKPKNEYQDQDLDL